MSSTGRTTPHEKGRRMEYWRPFERIERSDGGTKEVGREMEVVRGAITNIAIFCQANAE